jgi:hypothetical protein
MDKSDKHDFDPKRKTEIVQTRPGVFKIVKRKKPAKK